MFQIIKVSELYAKTVNFSILHMSQFEEDRGLSSVSGVTNKKIVRDDNNDNESQSSYMSESNCEFFHLVFSMK